MSGSSPATNASAGGKPLAAGARLSQATTTAMLARRDALEQLSARREVLALIAQGRSNAGIARLPGISEKSVDDHRRVLAVVR